MRVYHAFFFMIAISLFTCSSGYTNNITLHFNPDSLAIDTFPPPRNLDGLTQDDAVQLWWEVPLLQDTLLLKNSGFFVPENLLGYNVYRDNTLLDHVVYNNSDTTYYWDLTIPYPATYEYSVTALYDLTPAGMPGDTAESEPAGPFAVFGGYAFILPFVEDWNTASFDPNLWTKNENWVINGQFGNEQPSAEFKWDPILTNYSSSLTSYWIDGKYNPNTSDPYIDGRLWLDFDITLDAVNTTGSETLVVELWKNDNWYTLTTFDNSNGSFIWTNNHIDITGIAFGEIFRVRFRAEGNNSSDILSWFNDNLHIYRQCDAPTNLVAVGVNDFEIDLSWATPEITKKESTRALLGYNIYWNNDGAGYEYLDFTSDTFYQHIVDPAFPCPSTQCYYTSAVYEDCESNSNESCWIVCWIGVQEKPQKNIFSLHPNPADKKLYIKYLDNQTSLTISIYNMLGREMDYKNLLNNQDLICFNTTDYPEGVYLVVIKENQRVIEKKKIIVAH